MVSLLEYYASQRRAPIVLSQQAPRLVEADAGIQSADIANQLSSAFSNYNKASQQQKAFDLQKQQADRQFGLQDRQQGFAERQYQAKIDAQDAALVRQQQQADNARRILFEQAAVGQLDPIALDRFDAGGNAEAQLAIAQDLLAPQQGYTLKQGETRFGPDGQVIGQGYVKPEAAPKPIVVGGALVDPVTGQTLYEAPPEAPNSTDRYVKTDAGLFDATTGQIVSGTAGPEEHPDVIQAGRLSGIEPGSLEEKALVQDYYSKRRQGEAAAGFKVPAGYQRDPNNPDRVIPIPNGPKDPTVLANRPEAQLKSQGFADRASASDDILSGLEQPGAWEAAQTAIGDAAGSIVGLGTDSGAAAVESMIKSGTAQQRDQAQRDFVTAVLRKESGAVIGASEFANEARKFFPQAGDTQAVVQQKAAARQRAIANLQREGGLQPESKPQPTGSVLRESSDADLIGQLKALGMTDAEIQAALTGG